MDNQNLPVMEVRNFKKHFKVKNKGILHAVDGISFSVQPGQTLGLVGESGCGKSTVGNVIMRLHKATAGEVLFKGKNVLDSRGSESMEFRKKIQIIFQDPYSSLNPKKTINSILEEAYRIHGLCTGQERREKMEKIIELCGLEKYVLEKYPHDLSVVRHISQRVAVMYLGQIIEMADTDDIFANALHPYTIALLSAVPKIDFEKKTSRIVLKGDVPSPINPGEGCRFAPRCFLSRDICRTRKPELLDAGQGHCVACHFYGEAREKAKNMEAGMAAEAYGGNHGYENQ
ncbi:oligopeptide/dipeptide ABC transporter ATP-binding protein [Lachnospiraceae bacterium 54-53]